MSPLSAWKRPHDSFVTRVVCLKINCVSCIFAPGFSLDEWMFKFAASTYFTHHQKEKATSNGNPKSNDESCGVVFLWPHVDILSRSLDLFRCRFRWVAKTIDAKGATQRWFL